ncbi:MAG: hypothetical protein WC870_01750 [Candidatus Paceibacterota bacterium]
MINPKTSKPSELFEGLIEIELQLQKKLEELENTYNETYQKVSVDFKVAGILEYEHDSGSLGEVIKHANEIIKIIENILHSETINKAYTKRLKSITEIDRKTGLKNFKQGWLKDVGNHDYITVLMDALSVDEWIDKCKEVAHYLADFVGEKNPLVEDLNLNKTSKEKTEIKGIDNSSEEIYLKTLGIKIKGDCIAKGTMNLKKVFNPTEKALIYFLFFRFLKNKDECFTIDSLAKELKKSEAYIKNSLTNIYKIIRKTMSQANTSIKWEPLIKNEPRRGYHLNPRLFIEVIKK